MIWQPLQEAPEIKKKNVNSLQLNVTMWIMSSNAHLCRHRCEVSNGNTVILGRSLLSEIIVEKVNLHVIFKFNKKTYILFSNSLLTLLRTTTKLGRPSGFVCEAGLFWSSKRKSLSSSSVAFFPSGLTGLHWSLNFKKRKKSIYLELDFLHHPSK